MNIGNYVKRYSEDLRLKNYSENTIENYCSQVKCFLENFNSVTTKPSEISEKQIKQWLLQAKSINGRKHRLSAVKLFYKLTGKQPLKFKNIEYPRSERKLPKVINKEFLLDRISKIENLKHNAIISVAYSCGLRVSEVCNLQIKDIDSSNNIIYIRQAKGKKDRIVPLSATILELLRKYFKEFKPNEYLFNGQFDLRYSERSCNQIVKKYLGKEYHFHLLRHSNATALLESGTNISLIQKLLGHNSPNTTQIYTHVSTQLINRIQTPI